MTLSPITIQFCNKINRFKYVILLLYFSTTIAGFFSYSPFLSKTDSSLVAPSSSLAAKASQAFNSAYGVSPEEEEEDGAELLILIQSNTNPRSSLIDGEANEELYNYLKSYVNSLHVYTSEKASSLCSSIGVMYFGSCIGEYASHDCAGSHNQ